MCIQKYFFIKIGNGLIQQYNKFNDVPKFSNVAIVTGSLGIKSHSQDNILYFTYVTCKKCEIIAMCHVSSPRSDQLSDSAVVLRD